MVECKETKPANHPTPPSPSLVQIQTVEKRVEAILGFVWEHFQGFRV